MLPSQPQEPLSQGLSSASNAAPSGSGFGLGSLGTSLAIHGALMASLVLALKSASAPSDAGGVLLNVQAELEDTASLQWRHPEPQEVVESIVPEPREKEMPLDLDAVGPPPAPPSDDVFEEPFNAADPALPLWDVEDLLEDPELPKKAAEIPVAEPDPAPAAAPPEESTANEGAGAIVSPNALPADCPMPVYPRVAERRGWTGTVVLLIHVSADGSVSGVEVESSSGHDVLDEAALSAVRTWKFRPGTLSGKPAALTVRKPIQFGE